MFEHDLTFKILRLISCLLKCLKRDGFVGKKIIAMKILKEILCSICLMSDNILFLKIVVSFATRILVPSGLKFLIHWENGTYASKCMLEMY